jgi:hypothetical protein
VFIHTIAIQNVGFVGSQYSPLTLLQTIHLLRKLSVRDHPAALCLKYTNTRGNNCCTISRIGGIWSRRIWGIFRGGFVDFSWILWVMVVTQTHIKLISKEYMVDNIYFDAYIYVDKFHILYCQLGILYIYSQSYLNCSCVFTKIKIS